jgi:predicted GNAT superfamily acetyltransferase
MDWRLDAPRVVAAASGVRLEPPDVEALLQEGRALLTDPEGAQAAGLLDTPGPLLCPTPAAIQTLRRENPDQARRWRFAVRRALTEAMASGYRVTGFTRSGWYLLDHVEGASDQ